MSMICGQVRNLFPFWESLTEDKYILSLIKGVTVPFINGRPPIQRHLPKELKMNDQEMKFVDDHLLQLVAQGFIKELRGHIKDGWVSNVFLVPKKQG